MKSLLSKCLAAAVFTGLSVSAFAGANKVYSPAWAWNNNFNSSAYTFNFGTGTNPQWNATFNLPNTGGLKGYPASIRGWHYGWNPANDNLFPRKVSSTTKIPLAFSYYGSGTLSGDFAYDVFLRYDTAKSAPQLEVMVWGNNDSYPVGTRQVQNILTVNGVTYDLWAGMNTSAGYYVYTFIPVRTSVPADVKTGSGSINIDLMTFLAKLNGRGYYNTGMYIHAVEAGFEIVGGNGTIRCDWFTCSAQ